MKGIPAWSCSALVPMIPHSRFSLVLSSPAVQEEADAVSLVNTKRAQLDPGDCSWRSFFYYYNITYQITFFVVREVCFSTWSRLILQPPWKIISLNKKRINSVLTIYLHKFIWSDDFTWSTYNRSFLIHVSEPSYKDHLLELLSAKEISCHYFQSRHFVLRKSWISFQLKHACFFVLGYQRHLVVFLNWGVRYNSVY